MHTRSWSFKETSLVIKCDDKRAIDVAIDASLRARREIERFIIVRPEFRWSLEPLRLKGEYPRVIELMSRAAEIADVGPFAAVAGSISQIAAEAAHEAGAKNVLVENGGDIAIISDMEFRVGIYAGGAGTSGKIGFLVRREDLPIGICTSSGTVGHSVSLGQADAVVAVANEASVADAAATSIANAVRGADIESSIERGLDRGHDIPEIRGCLIVRGGHIGTSGKLLELIRVSPKAEEISIVSKKYQSYGLELAPIL